MKKSLLIVFFLSALTSGRAQTNVSSKVEAVTVYLQGAVVTRSAEVNIKTGVNEFRLSGITDYINPSSIQVEGDDRFTILSVRHSVDRDAQSVYPPAVQVKLDSLEEARFEVKTKVALRETYAEELELLQANRTINGNQNVLLVEDLADMADFYRERVKELKYKTIELQVEEQELQDLMSRLQQELNDLQAQRPRRSGEIYVKLGAELPSKTTLKVSYYVTLASWVPFYDLRSEGTDQSLELTYRAKVRQSTGVDWTGVNLMLSSGDPSIGGNPPELSPWWIYMQQQYKKQAYRTQAAYSMEVAEAAPEDEMAMSSDRFDAGVTIKERFIASSFSVNIPYDIPSNNQFYDVELQEISLPADYRHFAVPKLQQEAFLTADVTDWEQYSLLPGDASIYFQGDYVGKSFIDPFQTTDTLQLSFGRDPGVVISHEQIKDLCKTSTFGGKKKTTRAYKIMVTNTRPKAVSLRLEDQIPLTTDTDIEVETEELSGGSLDLESGKVTWDVTIGPGETRELILRFSVRYPRKKPVANL